MRPSQQDTDRSGDGIRHLDVSTWRLTRAVPTCLVDIRIGSSLVASLDAGTASVTLAHLKDRIAAELHAGIRAEDATVGK